MPSSYTEYVQGEIRAEMSRQRIAPAELLRKLGDPWSEKLVGRAIGSATYTAQPWLTVAELARLCAVLGLRPSVLLQRAEAMAPASAGGTGTARRAS